MAGVIDRPMAPAENTCAAYYGGVMGRMRAIEPCTMEMRQIPHRPVAVQRKA